MTRTGNALLLILAASYALGVMSLVELALR
jgi:hypothetical protein